MSDRAETAQEMPRYKSHKEVNALKIELVQIPSRTLHFHDKRFSPRSVSREYYEKHNPKAGGYYVVYEDGYESWSPGDVFEAGYTLVGGA